MSVKDTITNIKNYIAAKGFSYEDGLVENFYLSLKSKPFVILAGTSGTGKTRLVKLFAEAVGATTANGRYKMVSVRPDWSDSSDLFGHVDLNGKFYSVISDHITIYKIFRHRFLLEKYVFIVYKNKKFVKQVERKPFSLCKNQKFTGGLTSY